MSGNKDHTEHLLRLMLARREAIAAVQLLSRVAKQCDDPGLRESSILMLANVGVEAAGALQELLADSAVGAEVVEVARSAPVWPLLHSVWRSDQAEMERRLPVSEIGVSRKVIPGKWSLEKVQNRWAFAFLQHVSLCKVAWKRAPEIGAAKEYISRNYLVEIVYDDDILDAVKLPELSLENFGEWKQAFKRNVERHFPDFAICNHADWKDEGINASSDGSGEPIRKDSIEFQSWILGRVNRSIAQIAGIQ